MQRNKFSLIIIVLVIATLIAYTLTSSASAQSTTCSFRPVAYVLEKRSDAKLYPLRNPDVLNWGVIYDRVKNVYGGGPLNWSAFDELGEFDPCGTGECDITDDTWGFREDLDSRYNIRQPGGDRADVTLSHDRSAFRIIEQCAPHSRCQPVVDLESTHTIKNIPIECGENYRFGWVVERYDPHDDSEPTPTTEPTNTPNPTHTPTRIPTRTPTPEPDRCGKACTYSEVHNGETKCFTGNCLDGSQNCSLNTNCGFVPGCTDSREVLCPGHSPTPTRTPPPPIPTGTIPQGTGSCSYENLYDQTPTNISDSEKARRARHASCICQRESGSNPFQVNDGCIRNITAEYSVGLYQINLIFDDRCRPIPDNGLIENIVAKSCRIENQTKFDSCKNYYFNATNNIGFMKELSSNMSEWHHWSTHTDGGCGPF